MRKTKKKKLNLKKISIASIDELNSVKGGNTMTCEPTNEATCASACLDACSAKTHPSFISFLFVCMETLVDC